MIGLIALAGSGHKLTAEVHLMPSSSLLLLDVLGVLDEPASWLNHRGHDLLELFQPRVPEHVGLDLWLEWFRNEVRDEEVRNDLPLHRLFLLLPELGLATQVREGQPSDDGQCYDGTDYLD